MTVAELIEKLKTMPQDAIAVVNMGRNELANGDEASGVDTVNAYRYTHGDRWMENYYSTDHDEMAIVVNIYA